MILYRLVCRCGHEFETWFQSSTAYDVVAARGELTCLVCGGKEISKAIMAPSIAKQSNATEPQAQPTSAETATTMTPVASAHAEMMAAVRRLRHEVEAKADYVGPRFADEARKIDAGEAADRGIYGEATASEVRDLVEDGIAILPLPRLPEEHN